MALFYPIRGPNYSQAFLKKASGILLSPPSVCPLCHLLLNHWTKSNQILCLRYSHQWSMQQHLFAPHPGEGSNIIKFQLQSQFQKSGDMQWRAIDCAIKFIICYPIRSPITLTRPLAKICITKKNSYFSSKSYVVGTQKNRLNEMILLCTQKDCSFSS